MQAWWDALDFGGRRSTSLPQISGDTVAVSGISDADAASHIETDGEDGLIEEGPAEVNETSTQQPFNPRLFRQPSTSIELLRRLSREGREDTLRAEAEEEAMGREKIVWGVVEDDGLSDIAPSSEPTKQLAENASSAPVVAQASETGTVDVVDNRGEEDKE
jgi:hypothetical protein